MRFRKWHGAGNDFVMLDDWGGDMGAPGSLDAAFVRALCDRHTGIGADGVIRLMLDDDARDAGASVRMDYYNADGGAAEMCGNGIRCTVKLASALGRMKLGEHVVMTGAGPRAVTLGREVTVDMGEPLMSGEREAGGVTGIGVSMGNPHFVVFTDRLDRVLTDGPRLETHPAFPDRTNVEFVHVADETSIRMRVWERGIGETMACGSGACAAVAAAAATGRTKREVAVHLPGGTLRVAWGEDGRVRLRGPAQESFAGEVEPAALVR